MAKHLTRKIVQATQNETFDKAIDQACRMGTTPAEVGEALKKEWYRRDMEIKTLRHLLDEKNGSIAQLSQTSLFP